MSDGGLYVGREQSLVKHFILRHYLERFAIIVGARWNTLTYVDCFSGPWNVQSDDFKDSSFAIALEQLRKAREIHRDRTHRTLKLRCIFLEKDRSAYAKLKSFTDAITDVEIETQNKKLEDAIPLILDFVKRGGPKSFPFVFIDPTGWTGFAMATIAPLLKLNPGEVLINFMTGHIRRFIVSPQQQTQKSFTKLFGSSEFKGKLRDLEKRDREDAIVEAYTENVKMTGEYGYTSSTIVLHPEKDRTHFHLIYATRDPKGVEVFKNAEKKAMPMMQQVRGEAHKRKREEKTGQTELFGGADAHNPSYFLELRARYVAQARQSILKLLETEGRVSYDKAWSVAMKVPLSWESDLKDWIRDWKHAKCLEIVGLREGQRVPQLARVIHLVWKENRKSH